MFSSVTKLVNEHKRIIISFLIALFFATVAYLIYSEPFDDSIDFIAILIFYFSFFVLSSNILPDTKFLSPLKFVISIPLILILLLLPFTTLMMQITVGLYHSLGSIDCIIKSTATEPLWLFNFS
jgi:hypothetical protein